MSRERARAGDPPGWVGVRPLAVQRVCGTILVLALFIVMLNLLVDVVQTALDPRIKRA
jgi:ABC-type dipeptide/oligopeptide/nickel transport system permease component